MDEEALEKRFHHMLNSGEIYGTYNQDLLRYQYQCCHRVDKFNATPDTVEGFKEREKILRETVGTYGEGLYILPPVKANFGLKHVHFGKNVFVNFNVNFVDDADVFIGDNTLIGPNCTIATAEHLISPRIRSHHLQYNRSIHIGNNVWIGAGAIILSGVTIGDNSIVGAGSIVNKDVEPNTIVVGNPARVLRKITEEDDRFYDRGKEIPQEILDKYLKD